MRGLNLLCLALATGVASAQSLVELRPAKFLLSDSGTLVLNTLPQASWMFVRGDGTQANFDEVPNRLSIAQEGLIAVGADFKPRTRPLDGALMQSLGITQTGQWNVIEYASACALVRKGSGPPTSSAVATARNGLRFEIKPQMDPTCVPAGSDVAFKIYLDGEPLAGVTVKLAPLGAPQEVIRGSKAQARRFIEDPKGWVSKSTDASGYVIFTMPKESQWRVQVAVLKGEQLYSSTLTFQNGAAK